MARQFTLRHLGNDVTFLIPEAVSNIASSSSQQDEYKSQYNDLIYDHFTHTPINNSPVIGVRLQGTPSQAVIDRRNAWAASHIAAAKVVQCGDKQFDHNNSVQLWENNKFVNPENGRYLTVGGNYNNPTWTVCEEDDTVVSTFNGVGEFTGTREWWLIAFDTFQEFCEASTWVNASTHAWTMYITEPMQLSGDTDYDHFRYRIYRADAGSGSYSYFLHALYLLFGGTDPSEPEPEPEPDDPYTPYDPSGPSTSPVAGSWPRLPFPLP